MSKIAAFISGIGGILVLAGYFIPTLNTAYFLVPIGGVLAIISAIVATTFRPRYPMAYPRY